MKRMHTIERPVLANVMIMYVLRIIVSPTKERSAFTTAMDIFRLNGFTYTEYNYHKKCKADGCRMSANELQTKRQTSKL